MSETERTNAILLQRRLFPAIQYCAGPFACVMIMLGDLALIIWAGRAVLFELTDTLIWKLSHMSDIDIPTSAGAQKCSKIFVTPCNGTDVFFVWLRSSYYSHPYII